jgi:TonB family protein
MNGEFPFDGIHVRLDSRRQRLFGVALMMSLALHIAGLVTSPYWQSRPASPEDFMQVDIAEIPPQELPKLPDLPPAMPPLSPAQEAAPNTKGASHAPKPAPTREMIREKVARRGILKMITPEQRGDGGADLFSGIRIPKDTRLASKGSPSIPYSTSPAGEEDPSKLGRATGIGKHVDTASRASRELSSRIFRTDSGLEGEISGGIGDENRTSGAISSRVSQYRSGIRYAYNRELLKNPSLSGRIVVAFVILPDGSVESPEIRQSSVNWPPLDEAVLQRLRNWKFPKSRGTAVRVVFPFVFHPEM